jgi:hypothetical protein
MVNIVGSGVSMVFDQIYHFVAMVPVPRFVWVGPDGN